MDTTAKLRRFLDRLQSPFVGREEEAKVVTLTLLAREHAVLIGEPGCLTGDTIISSEDGKLFYIEDIARNSLPGIYIADFPLFPPGRATELHVYDVWETVEITTKRGFTVRVTPNHPLMTEKGWVEARNLKVGDKLLIYTKIPSPKEYVSIPNDEIMPERRPYRKLGWSKIRTKKEVKRPKILDESLAELLGAFVAEGFFGHGYIGFGIGIEEKDFQKRILNLMKGIFGIEKARVTGRKSKKSRTKNIVVLRFNSIYLVRLFRWLDHAHESDKRVPRWILISPKSVSAAFLRGLFEGDGSVNINKSHRTYNISLKSKSLKLLRGVQILLLRHGILSRIYESRSYDKRYNKVYTGYILRISGYDNLKKFQDEIGFISQNKREKLKLCLSMYSRKRSKKNIERHEDIIYDEVAKIKYIHEWVRVYDFHVPETHSFFSNGLLSHNTAKSALVRRAAELLNAKFFKYLLTRFTEPAELFGPLDIKSLEEGRYVRLTRGKLPDADIAFLDEIFKANSAILNALNSLLQERVLYDGFTEMDVPLWSLFGASNEVPDDPEVEALYDRFTVRHFVRPVPEDLWSDLLLKSWEFERAMYFRGGLDGSSVMSIADLRTLHEKVLNADLEPIKGKLVKLFAVFESRGVKVTDRRKGKSLKLIAANAVLEGRDYADERDLIVLKYVIPRDWDELDKVNMILSEELKTPYKYLKELEEIRNNVKEVMNYVISLQGVNSKYLTSRFKLILKDLEVTKEKVYGMMNECSDARVRRVAEDVITLISDVEKAIDRRMK